MQSNDANAVFDRLLITAQELHHAGDFADAMAAYSRAIAQFPARVEPYLGSGAICLSDGRFDEALYWFERARAMAPNSAAALEGTANTLLLTARPAEALALFEKLQAVAPDSSGARYGAGEALKQLGRLPEARQALERAIALAPDVAHLHLALADFGRFVANDPRLAGLERLERRFASLPEADQCDLHFTLAKACDDLGRHQEAFDHWQAGNAIKRRHVAYDEAMYLGILRDLAAAFTPEVIAARRGVGEPSEVPVFVVGMPRSGTTLVEQIIASHPDAFGAGESMYLHQLLGQNFAGADFPAHLSEVPNEALRKMGAFYAAHLRAKAPQAKRIVDKLPANFMLCGLIHLILPNAKIVHIKRDPLDTCLSCYANLFAQAIDYSYDLGELGRYYRAYGQLMDHWRAVLPPGAMLEVSYETLVGDFEPQARRIVEYCGLSWDPACLSFHKTKRVVHTLSSVQVREPVYARAIGRAAPYAAWLDPLREALI